MNKPEYIEIFGAASHNLKNIDIAFPLCQITAVTGVSGSGKSSLVFDTLYSESYRRYVESLSSFARQYMKALPRPKIREIRNLPPAIAVKQSRSAPTPRSTVGTMTELYDLLRIFFVHLSDLHCPSCGRKVEAATSGQVCKTLLGQKGPKGSYLVLAPLSRWEQIKSTDLGKQLLSLGFSKLVNPASVEPKDILKLSGSKMLASSILIDTIDLDAEEGPRLAEAIDTAFKLGRGLIELRSLEDKSSQFFSSRRACLTCDREFKEPSLALFSFNHPLGACEHCQGFGQEAILDWSKVISDKSRSLLTEGVALWNFGHHVKMYQVALKSAKSLGIDSKKSFSDYSKSDWQWLTKGDGAKFFGVEGYYEWLGTQKHKMHYRIHSARYRRYVTCRKCEGKRLNSSGLAYKILDQNISEWSQLSSDLLVKRLDYFEENQELASLKNSALAEASSEILARLHYLREVGLGYLTLDRLTRTLSGGEQQRVHLSRCLGSALTDTLYCLDEPSAGLHAHDCSRLIGVINNLKNLGNTVVMVEHEKQMIDCADLRLEIGPGAGHLGGEVVKEKQDKILWPLYDPDHKALNANPAMIRLIGAKTNNLKNVTLEFPAGKLTAICGVSGSGKTSLIMQTLYPMLLERFSKKVDQSDIEELRAKSLGPDKILAGFDDVMLVDQSPLGRSSRSNILTYLKLNDGLRKFFAKLPEAKYLGLTAGAFSFNSPGGRCETCRGLGTVVEDLSFLGEMSVICPDCNGKRFSDEVLSVKWEGMSLRDVLDLTVEEARIKFAFVKDLERDLKKITDIGLGYLCIGQSTSTFSGGEAQRLKLLRLMLETKAKDKPKILIFDEPSTGLSDKDVQALLAQLRLLREAGHTIIVVEHHLGVLASSDYLIEIGPGPGDAGGQILYSGIPKGLSQIKASPTASYLKAVFSEKSELAKPKEKQQRKDRYESHRSR